MTPPAVRKIGLVWPLRAFSAHECFSQGVAIAPEVKTVAMASKSQVFELESYPPASSTSANELTTFACVRFLLIR